MICSKCGFNNKVGKKFCTECGEKLSLRCPKCNSEIEANEKFCGECGCDLTKPSEIPPKDLSFDEKLDKIQKYLPKGLTEKILSQRDRIEGERKQVTVLFCDMEGFTQFSDRLGPEEAYSVMDQLYEILIHKVHDYEGTVNEFTGDGIMALFGAPIALEDAPQRAIRSAYAIHREMTRFSDKMKEERQDIFRLKMRIGIHTGTVVVGTLGNDLRVEFKAVGDTVNLASRIEGLAVPGSTYVSEDTFKLTEGLFRYEALGEYAVKGKAKSVKAYRVIAPSSSRTRFDVSAERGLTPFVGRERELELLLDGFERSKAGRGQAFSIVAEAGVGKSRLLYEFRKAVSNQDVTFQEGKCLSYSRDVTYHPVIDIVKSNSNIVEGDNDLEIREKLKRGLSALGVDEASTLPYFLELLSVKDSGVDLISLSREARKDRIIEALNRSTIKASQIRPLIMAIEDLHWIDKSSEESLKALLDSISGERIFLIFTYRPEYVHTWGSKSYHSQITLNRLSNRESLIMVNYLLGSEDIESDLEELILEKTEGVPFFIEEFIRSLQELKIIERKDNTYQLAGNIQELTIPATIQDVIMARVDTLPEGAKELLQLGSVIEREFNYELIKQVSKLSEKELLSLLSVLKDAEVIFERGIYPESNYIFKHALTREVVYDSILSATKKKLHNKTGKAIEQLYRDNLHEHFAVLAEHFISSDNFEKGAKYSKVAGKKSEKIASFVDAISYGEKRVFCLEKLPISTKIQKEIIDARTTLGLYFMQTSNFITAKKAINPIVDLASKSGSKRRLSQIYIIIGAHDSFHEEEFPRAFKHLEEALKIAEEINDIVSLFFANYWLGLTYSHNCEFEKAIFYLEKALNINVAANSLWGISFLKNNLSMYVYNYQGRVKLAYQNSREAVRLAEESGDAMSLTGYAALGISCFFKGFFSKAEKHSLKALDHSERINFLWANICSHINLGETYFEIGEYQKSKLHYGKAIRISEDNRILLSWRRLCKVSVAKTKVMNNEMDIDVESLFRFVAENKIKCFESSMQRFIGEILMYIDDQHLNEAEDWIKNAIESDKRNNMMWHLGRDYALYSVLFKRKCNQSKAKEIMVKAIEILTECGADGWVEKYEKELAELS